MQEQARQYLEALEAADRILAQYMGPKSPLRLGIAQLRDEQMAKEQAMAQVHILKPGEPEGTQRVGDPLPRPYVTLADGRTMPYLDWLAAGSPA